MTYRVSCQNCGKELSNDGPWWFICDKCNFRVCTSCLGHHSGKYSSGGFKCSQCAFGQMKGPRAVNWDCFVHPLTSMGSYMQISEHQLESILADALLDNHLLEQGAEVNAVVLGYATNDAEKPLLMPDFVDSLSGTCGIKRAATYAAGTNWYRNLIKNVQFYFEISAKMCNFAV